MPTPAFISIEGSNQGKITAGAFTEDSVGNVYVEGHEDEIMAQAISHIVTVPTDPQSGQPSGLRSAWKSPCRSSGSEGFRFWHTKGGNNRRFPLPFPP